MLEAFEKRAEACLQKMEESLFPGLKA